MWSCPIARQVGSLLPPFKGIRLPKIADDRDSCCWVASVRHEIDAAQQGASFIDGGFVTNILTASSYYLLRNYSFAAHPDMNTSIILFQVTEVVRSDKSI